MAYKTDNEKRTELLSIKKDNRGNVIKVALIEKTDTGKKSVDIRNFFTPENGELTATSKGVRLKQEETLELVKSLLNTLDANELTEVINTAEELIENTESESETDDDEEDEDEEDTEEDDADGESLKDYFD